MRIVDYFIEKLFPNHRKVNRAIDRALRDAIDGKEPDEDLKYINDMTKEIELTDREKEKIRIIDTLRFRKGMGEILNRVEKKMIDHEDKLNDLHSRMKDIEILTKGETKYDNE